jgi:tol-pal system protein YbgF
VLPLIFARTFSAPRALAALAPLLLCGALPIASSCVIVGCAHSDTAQDRELAKLQDDLARIQTEHDALDKRVDAIEMHTGANDSDEADPVTPSSQTQKKSSANDSAPSDAASAPTPQLRVVHLDPDGSIPKSDAEEDPNDTSTRPMLQVIGNAPSRSAGKTSSDLASRKTGADAAVFDPQAKRAYDVALSLALQKKYDEALDAFAAFLVKWPDHPNADNATYWRGECYFAKGNFQQAAEQFEGVIARFPFGNKVPDALLKLSTTYEKLGDADRAQQATTRLLRDYPRSEAARRISTNAAKKPEKSGAPSP